MGNGGDDKKISSPESEEKYLDKPAEVFSRDLLQSFLGSTSEHETMKEEELEKEEGEEIELNLGLSLGGGFGVEPLMRSSSTASFLHTARDVSDTSPSAVEAKSSLARTSSMPVETEDEKRKRKELQSLRRMEAKRRRSDKKKAVKGDKEMEVNWMGDLEREKKLDISAEGQVFEASSNLGGRIDAAIAKGKGVSGRGSGGMKGFGQVLSQGLSTKSTGKSSSSLIGGLEGEKHLPMTKKLNLLVGGPVFEASSNLGGGIDAAMSKGKGVSAWGSGGMQGFGSVVSQGSSMESTGGSSSSLMGGLEGEKQLPVTKKLDLLVGGPVFEASSNLGGGIEVAMAKGKGVSAWGTGGMQGFGQMLSQGSSVESTGGSSSVLSDLESKALQGSSGELSPASTLSLCERSKLDVGSSKTEVTENPGITTGSLVQSSAKPPVDASRTGGRDTRTSAVEDMPSVYTRGDGPNGRRVDGILYRYGRGEEVRIMCICHGTFHSPVDFVLHAGGTNVDNPLRHIVIIPNSSPLL
ncbi:uncharacterized protein [Primulina eburnea]|uniref:uncharacterized protein n=1 Tax=Primulina eburnea TaxID=1245227 RepID=UPI003C6C1AE8